MRSILIIACLSMSVTIAGCRQESETNTSATQQDESAAAGPAGEAHAQEIRFVVRGMTCEQCENAIDTTVRQLAGVVSCTSSAAEGSTIVHVTDPAVVDDVLREVVALGYQIERAN